MVNEPGLLSLKEARTWSCSLSSDFSLYVVGYTSVFIYTSVQLSVSTCNYTCRPLVGSVHRNVNPQYQSKSRRRSSLLCRLSGKYKQCWRQIDSDFSCSLSCSYIFVFTVVMSLYAEMHTRKCDAVTDNFI